MVGEVATVVVWGGYEVILDFQVLGEVTLEVWMVGEVTIDVCTVGEVNLEAHVVCDFTGDVREGDEVTLEVTTVEKVKLDEVWVWLACEAARETRGARALVRDTRVFGGTLEDERFSQGPMNHLLRPLTSVSIFLDASLWISDGSLILLYTPFGSSRRPPLPSSPFSSSLSCSGSSLGAW